MKRTVILNVVGLTRRLIGDCTPAIARFAAEGALCTVRPAFPAVTCTAQATYLTGGDPAEHGIVANGWYDRALAEVHFWKQSNRLVAGKKLWERARETDPGFTCANLFWWFNRYSSVDYSVTPRPIYCADGKKVFDITSIPVSLTPEIKRELGAFPFAGFWGPRAGIASSRWIAHAARWMEERHQPSLNLVYLPHLDYDLQRLGPDLASPVIQRALREIDAIVGELIAFFEARGVRVILLSEYGITPVNQPVCLNRIFRRRGWLAIKDELGREVLDCGASRVFAVADHQVAHVYVNDADPAFLAEVRAALEQVPGVETILDREAQQARGLWHARSGDFLVSAAPNAWFCYYYWEDDRRAPDFARTVDIHRKPGYDPAELFIDPAIRFPLGRVAKFLLKKRLGLRALLELTPLDATLVRGSHGRVPEDIADHPVLLAGRGEGALPPAMAARDVFPYLLGIL
ncbi:MAG: alkaline phosphatase family protein [Chthoniobacteraceae bacterium]|nr:alkaline phosphatase family protein [Chthoniobacteraceae bacterium]